jgi:hypothetical protein
MPALWRDIIGDGLIGNRDTLRAEEYEGSMSGPCYGCPDIAVGPERANGLQLAGRLHWPWAPCCHPRDLRHRSDLGLVVNRRIMDQLVLPLPRAGPSACSAVSGLFAVACLLPSLLNSWCTAKCSISTTSSALHLTDAAKRRELSRIKSTACDADPAHDPRCARLALRRRDGTFAAA